MQAEPDKGHSAELDRWIETATQGLVPEACERIRREIESHVRDMVEAKEADGLGTARAWAMALESLGPPDEARKKFEKIYLTVIEAKLIDGILKIGQRGFMQAWLVMLILAIFIFFAFLAPEPKYAIEHSVKSIAVMLGIFVVLLLAERLGNRLRMPPNRMKRKNPLIEAIQMDLLNMWLWTFALVGCVVAGHYVLTGRISTEKLDFSTIILILVLYSWPRLRVYKKLNGIAWRNAAG